MPGRVRRERRRDECGELVGNPGRREDPRDPADLGLRVLRIAGPGPDRDLALVAGKRRQGLSRGGIRLRDELDQARHEGQTFRVVGGQRRVARLAEPAHVPDERDRPRSVVVALEAPRRDRRIVERTVEGEVQLDVPLEAVDGGTGAADPQVRGQLVGREVGEHVPVTRWGLGVGPVRPELCHDPPEIGLVHDVRRVRLAGRRIDRVAGAVVRAEAVVAARAWGDVDGHARARVERAAVPDDLDDLVLEHLVGRGISQPGRGAGIDRDARGAAGGQAERRDVTPDRADGLLHPVGHRDAVLGDHVRDLKWLPAVGIAHERPGHRDDEGRIDGLVGRVVVSGRLVRPVCEAVGDHSFRDPVPDRRRRVADRRGHVDRVAQRVHEVVELGERRVGADRLDVSLGEDAIRRVADGLVARGGHVRRGVLLADEVAGRLRVVRGPRVPHRRRHVEQVPGMDRGCRERPPDRVEERFVPATCHRPLGMARDCGAGRRLALEPWDRQARRHHADHHEHRQRGARERAPGSTGRGPRRDCGNPVGRGWCPGLHRGRSVSRLSRWAAPHSGGPPGQGRRVRRWYRGDARSAGL